MAFNAYLAIQDPSIRSAEELVQRIIAVLSQDFRSDPQAAGSIEKLGLTKEAVEAYKGFIEHAPPDSSYIEHARMRIRALE